MRSEINFNAQEFAILQSKIKGNFDNPKKDIKCTRGKLFFSGWFLVDNQQFCIKVVNNNINIEEHFLTLSRPDVVKYFSLPDRYEFCGFQFQVDIKHENTKIIVCAEGIDHTIWHIKKSSHHDSDTAIVANKWISLHEEKKEITHLFDTNNIELNKEIISSLFSISDIESLHEKLTKKNITIFDSQENLSHFISHFKQSYWAMEAIQKSSKDGLLKETLRPANVEYYCTGSYAVDDFNFILFDGIGCQFYIVQHCTNVLMIFPTLFTCIQLNIAQWGAHAIDKIPDLFLTLQKLEKSGATFPRKKIANFSGVNISQSRPYHFVYDYLHGLDYLANNMISLRSVSISGFDFIEAQNFFENIYDFYSIEQNRLNSRTITFNDFYLMPCLQYVNGDYDRELKSLSERLKKGYLLNQAEKNVDYELVLWIGISVEKRSWVEQATGIVAILKKLKEKRENILVLIDGRTLTLTGMQEEKILSREEDIFKEICKSLPEIECRSLIGLTMAEKIFFASSVDLFLTSFSTDSLYVSCIHGKKGVIYVAPSINGQQRKLHVHHTVTEIPKNKITEVNSNNKSWHETSVSIDWRDIYNCIEDIIK